MRRYAGFTMMLMALVLALGATFGGGTVKAQANLFEAFLLALRGDLETLADEQLGPAVRPDTWTLNIDVASPTFVTDLWFDIEQLANSIYGENSRPPEWFGVTTQNPELLARNVRHDLELAADEVYGDGERPENWQGAARIFSCSRTLQNLVRLLDVFYNTRSDVFESVFDYCGAVRLDIINNLSTILFTGEFAANELPELSLALRGDLERLADELLGLNNRPSQWVDNTDVASATLIADVNADLERLADERFGRDIRPPEWQPFITGSPSLAYRNLRFNLELMADLELGEDVRPNGWQGQNSLELCDPIDQSLVLAVQQVYVDPVSADFAESPDFCQIVTDRANDIAENPPIDEEAEQELIEEDVRFRAASENAFAYLDRAALQYMGQMPFGTEFRAWYRNFNESTMMFVSGVEEGTGLPFAVWIDQRWTTMDIDTFRLLDTTEGVVPLTFCDASWCNGPSPTPTPTGGGPLVALRQQSTPQPTVDIEQESAQQGKTQVNFENIRVNYLLERPDVGRVQVTLELCNSPAQIACEPVIRIFNNRIGAEIPVISQFNGLNVYELPYGYTTDLLIESQNFTSPDVWLNDPTTR